MQHSEFTRIAENPELIETDRELKDLLDHLDNCDQCSRAANRWLEIETTLAPAHEKLRMHPSLVHLWIVKLRGAERELNSRINLACWHAAHCPICQHRLGKFSLVVNRTPAWIAVAALVLLLGGALLLFHRPDRETRTVNVNPAGSATESVYLVSGLQVSDVSAQVDRGGSSRSVFVPPQEAKRILVDSQSQDFSHRLEIAMKQEFTIRSYQIVVTRDADARVRIIMINNEQYRFQYISGSQAWSIEEHISPQSDPAATKAVQLFINTIGSRMAGTK
jgi:hypothetical protein